MIYEKCYDVILEGYETVTEGDAIDWATGFVFGECETSEQNIAHAHHVDTVNGIGIHYCYGADHYFFTDESGEDDE